MRDELIDFLETLNNDLNGTLLSKSIPKYVDKVIKLATIISISKNGKIKAFIAFYDNDENKELAYLTMIAVCKTCWYLGYGKNLLECSLNQLNKKEFKRYRLQVKEDNLKAIRLYENYGFVRIGIEEGMVNMEKQL